MAVQSLSSSRINYFLRQRNMRRPAPAVRVDYLVIVGGGGGVSNGGGGAGGYRNSMFGESSGGGALAEAPLRIAVGTTQGVTIGAGGGNNTNGANSIFGTITSLGGGRGLTNPQTGSGGSGGGGSHVGGAVGVGTAGQGYNGGLGNSQSCELSGGGGGGAGELGQNSASGTGPAGRGGNGLSSSITGSAVTRAGGGGGSIYSCFSFRTAGLGGTGGGGNGSSHQQDGAQLTCTPGAVNTGGGGGASQVGVGSPAGGSGVVILRYPSAFTIIIGAGLTASPVNQAVGTNERFTTITAGTGNVSWVA